MLDFLKNNKKAKKDNNSGMPVVAQTSNNIKCHPYSGLSGYGQMTSVDIAIYKELKKAVPIIDAAINKIIRLMGTFFVTVGNDKIDHEIKYFLENVRVSGLSQGIYSFLYSYMDSLLSYGNAVGEIVTCNEHEKIYGLYNAPIDSIQIKSEGFVMDSKIFVKRGYKYVKAENENLILFTSMNPQAGEIYGKSILEGLPFMSDILLKIYNAIGQNFERVGNIRFAVTYNPGSDAVNVQDRAKIIAREWSKAMDSSVPKDFVAVGDVDIKVIGADNQIISTEVPVKQILEQIVAKLGIPPFLLGLNWSSTERMSTQQSDILMGELVSYQNMINPVIKRICQAYLRFNGYHEEVKVIWDKLSLQDMVESANARLLNAKARKIEMENEKS